MAVRDGREERMEMELAKEREALDAVVARLRAEFTGTDETELRRLVEEIGRTLSDDATVRQFLPLLVHREAKQRLSSLSEV